MTTWEWYKDIIRKDPHKDELMDLPKNIESDDIRIAAQSLVRNILEYHGEKICKILTKCDLEKCDPQSSNCVDKVVIYLNSEFEGDGYDNE